MNNDNIRALASNYSKCIITISVYTWMLCKYCTHGDSGKCSGDDGRARRLL